MRGLRSIVATLGMVAALAVPLHASTEATPGEAALALGTGDIQQVVGAPKGAPLSGTKLDRRTAQISELLRCPVCQGLSISDSPSSLARKMKALVRAMLAAGYQEEQILHYFRYSYGEFVILKPPVKGASATVWIAPVIALLLGGGVIWWWMRRSNRPIAQAGPAPDAKAASAPGAERELDPYLTRVRRLVEGDEPAGPASSRKES